MVDKDQCPNCKAKGTYAVISTTFGTFWLFRCACCGYGDGGDIEDIQEEGG